MTTDLGTLRGDRVMNLVRQVSVNIQGPKTPEFQSSCSSQEHKSVDGGGKSDERSAANSDETFNPNCSSTIYHNFIPCHLWFMFEHTTPVTKQDTLGPFFPHILCCSSPLMFLDNSIWGIFPEIFSLPPNGRNELLDAHEHIAPRPSEA